MPGRNNKSHRPQSNDKKHSTLLRTLGQIVARLVLLFREGLQNGHNVS
jgi:hypothetical protein